MKRPPAPTQHDRERLSSLRFTALEDELAQRAANERRLTGLVHQLRVKLDEFRTQNSTNVQSAERELGRLNEDVQKSLQVQNFLEIRYNSAEEDAQCWEKRYSELKAQHAALERTFDTHRAEFRSLDSQYVDATDEVALVRAQLSTEEQSRHELEILRVSECSRQISAMKQLEAYKRRDRREWAAVCFRDQQRLLRSIGRWKFQTRHQKRVRRAYRVRVLPLVLGRAVACWSANLLRRRNFQSLLRRKNHWTAYAWFDLWARRAHLSGRIRRILPHICAKSSRECAKTVLRSWRCVADDNARHAYNYVFQVRVKIVLKQWHKRAHQKERVARLCAIAWGFGADKCIRRAWTAWRYFARRELFSHLREWRSSEQLRMTAFETWRQCASRSVWIARRVPEMVFSALRKRSGRECFLALKWWADVQRQVRRLRDRVGLSMGGMFVNDAFLSWRAYTQRCVLLRRKFIERLLGNVRRPFHQWQLHVRKQVFSRRASAFLWCAAERRVGHILRRWHAWTRSMWLYASKAKTLAGRVRLDVLHSVMRGWARIAREGGCARERALQEKVTELEQVARDLEKSLDDLDYERLQVTEQLHKAISKQAEEKVDADDSRRTLAAHLAEKEELKHRTLTQVESLKKERDTLHHSERLLRAELDDSLDIQGSLRAILRQREEQKQITLECTTAEGSKVVELASQLEGLRCTLAQRTESLEAQNEKLRAEVRSLRLKVRDLDEQLEHKSFCVQACELELRRIKYEESLRVV